MKFLEGNQNILRGTQKNTMFLRERKTHEIFSLPLIFFPPSSTFSGSHLVITQCAFQSYLRLFHKITFVVTWTILAMCLLTVCCVAVFGGSQSSRTSSGLNILICVIRMNKKSYGSGMTLGWVFHNRIFILHNLFWRIINVNWILNKTEN